MSETGRVGVLVITHPPLATALRGACEMIVGGQADFFEPIEVDASTNPEALQKKIADAVARQDQGRGVILLVDFLGGSPSNAALGIIGNLNTEVVTGVNLPMLLKLATNTFPDMSLPEVAQTLAKVGQTNIRVASALLARGG